MKSRQTRLSLLGLAFGVLLALLIAPPSRWLVRLQCLTALRLYHPMPVNGASYTPSAMDDRDRYEAVAARRPDDYALQYALCVAGNSPDDTLKSLHALTLRFPDRPALYANILRYEMLGKVQLERPEEEALLNPGPRPDDSRMHFNAPTDLAAFDQAAAAGETLDPDNAYFPWMRAVGLFAAFRDADGLAAFRRASHKTVWREYSADEVEARWRLHGEAFNDPGALGRVNIAASVLLPQYQQLRALARLILVKAVQQEAAGHREEGLELRESLRRCGDLMRSQAPYAIGALVGDAICAITTYRTGGMTQGATPDPISDQQLWQGLDAYRAYATRLGHPQLAARAGAEAEAGRQVSAILRLDDPGRLQQLDQPFLSLTRWWLADIAVLSNVLWLLLLGGAAARLARSRWVRKAGEGAGPAPMTRGATASRGLLVAAVLAAGFLLADSLLHFFQPPDRLGGIIRDVETLSLLLAIFALPPTLAVRLMRHGLRRPAMPRAWPGLLRAAGVALLLGACLYGLGALVVWQGGGLDDLAAGLHSLLGVPGAGDERDDARRASARWLSAAAVFAVPLLLLLASGGIALVRRAPFWVGLVRGFSSAALPTACLLLLLWGGLLLGTVRQEAAVDTQVWHQSHDEGPYLAAQMGKPWPGPVR